MPVSAVIGILTYKRPAELARLLTTLENQSRACPDDVRILVIDNDPERSAESVVTPAAFPDAEYVGEPQPGIAAGRNRALTVANDAEVLLFIDDDETPSEHWLTEMIGAHRRFPAACIVGPVISTFDGDIDPWIRLGGFFARARHRTGAKVPAAGTGNILLNMAQVRALGLRFDERFGLTGGSDTLFTRQLIHHGVELIWCDEAPVNDHVPAGRLSRRWVLKRGLRSGNSWSRATLVLAGTGVRRWEARLRLTGRGAVRIAGGSGQVLFGCLTNSVFHRARGSRTLFRGLGFLTGAYGYVYTEYKRPA